MVSVLASVDGGQLTSSVEKPASVLKGSYAVNVPKCKAYFTHLNKVSSKKYNINLVMHYVNNVFTVFTLPSDNPFLWNYIFSTVELLYTYAYVHSASFYTIYMIY